MALVSERIKKASKGSRLRSLFASSDSDNESEADITTKDQQQQQTQATWTADHPLPDIQTQEEQHLVFHNAVHRHNDQDFPSQTPKRFPDVVEIVDTPDSSRVSSITQTLRTSERKQMMMADATDLQPLKRQLMTKDKKKLEPPRVSLSPANAKPRVNRTSNVSTLESLAAPPAHVDLISRKRASDAFEGLSSLKTTEASSVDMVDLGSTGPPRKKIKQRKDSIAVEVSGKNIRMETLPHCGSIAAVESHLSEETEEKHGCKNVARVKKKDSHNVVVTSKARTKKSKRKSTVPLETDKLEFAASNSPVQEKKSKDSELSPLVDAHQFEKETRTRHNSSSAAKKKSKESTYQEVSVVKKAFGDDANVLKQDVSTSTTITRRKEKSNNPTEHQKPERTILKDSYDGDSSMVQTVPSKSIVIEKAKVEQDVLTTNVKAKTTTQNKDSSPSSAVKPKKKRTFQDQVLAEMLFSCRPYNLKTLAQALNTTDQALQHLMLSLLDKKIVIKKEFASKSGKVKELYWANQESTAKEVMKIIPDPSEMELAMKELATLQQQETEYSKEMTILTQELSNAEIQSKLAEMEASVTQVKEKLVATHARIKAFKMQQQQQSSRSSMAWNSHNKFQKSKSAALLAKERCPRRTKIRINAMRGEWKSRKEKCMDFVDQIADGMEKKPKEIIKLLELETDEMEGVTMPPKHTID